MYLAHFGLSEPPFRITPHTEFFFQGANRGATLEALLYAITHDEGIVKVTGEVGSGKTMLCRVLLERLPAPVVTIYLANPSLGRDEILLTIAEELKVDTSGKRTTVLLRALQDRLIQLYAKRHRVVVLIDEAHAMPAETLEEIRLLSNLESNRHKLLQIILFGQPELDEHLNLPNMRQLRERITHSFPLEPLVRSDIDSYIDFRMRAAGYKGPSVFSKAALKEIARASEGLTRRVNIMADKSLLAAFAGDTHQVTIKHARAAAADSGFRRMRPLRPSWRLATATLVVGTLLGFGINYFLTYVGTWDRGGHPEGVADNPAALAVAPARRTDDAAHAPAEPRTQPRVSTAEVLRPVEAGFPSTPPSAAAPESPAPVSARASLVASGPAASGLAASGPATSVSAVPNRPLAPDHRPAPAEHLAATSDRPVLPEHLAAVRDRTVSPGHAAALNDKPLPLTIEEDSGPQPMGGPFRTAYAQERFAAASSWMAAAPEKSFSIQLMTAKESDIAWVENFLSNAQQLANSDQLYVYSWPLDRGRGYRVAYGLYDNLWACRDAIAALPKTLTRFQPYPETMAVVRKLSGMQTSGMAQR